MIDLTVSQDDIDWLESAQSRLEINKKTTPISISGPLEVNMIYEDDSDTFIIRPENYHGAGISIKDKYEIEILLQGSDLSQLPQVRETGGRIKLLAQKRSLPQSDLHLNDNDTVCFCLPDEEHTKFIDGFKLKTFIDTLVVPFFYSQSYYETYGSWPWGERSHGILGILEGYSEIGKSDAEKVKKTLDTCKKYRNQWSLVNSRLKKKNMVKGHMICICGSDKIRNCHRDAFHGLWKLDKDLSKYDLRKSV